MGKSQSHRVTSFKKNTCDVQKIPSSPSKIILNAELQKAKMSKMKTSHKLSERQSEVIKTVSHEISLHHSYAQSRKSNGNNENRKHQVDSVSLALSGYSKDDNIVKSNESYVRRWLKSLEKSSDISANEDETLSTSSSQKSKRKPYESRLESGNVQLVFKLLDGLNGTVYHTLEPYPDVSGRGYKTRSKCRYCGSNTYYYCGTCLAAINRKIPLCKNADCMERMHLSLIPSPY